MANRQTQEQSQEQTQEQTQQGQAQEQGQKQTQKQEQTQPQDDPNRLVKVKLLFDRHNKSKGLYVNVNNHNFFIPTGKEVKVPYYIKAVIDNSAAQDANTAALIQDLGTEANF